MKGCSVEFSDRIYLDGPTKQSAQWHPSWLLNKFLLKQSALGIRTPLPCCPRSWYTQPILFPSCSSCDILHYFSFRAYGVQKLNLSKRIFSFHNSRSSLWSPLGAHRYGSFISSLTPPFFAVRVNRAILFISVFPFLCK